MQWQRFLEENNIHFVTRGPNTKRGELSIHCPMCGMDDPSEHLGINLQTEKWGCLRDGSHRGKSSRTLVKAILGCSSTQAGLIVKQYSHSDPDSLEAALNVLEADQNHVIQHDADLALEARHQKLGPQFKDFSQIKPRGITKRFFQHLVDRGYENPQDIIQDYDLRCAMTGRYKDRIIIPVKLNGDLLGWTSRAIGNPKNAPRYLMSNEDVKTTVFNYDELKKGGERLFIVEGPFDAIRLDNFGLGNPASTGPVRGFNIRATCTFGTSVAISQIALLRSLVKKYEETWVLFDQGADGPANHLAEWVGAKVAYLPSDVKDPGELKPSLMADLTASDFRGYVGMNLWWQTSFTGRSKALANSIMKNNTLLAHLNRKKV